MDHGYCISQNEEMFVRSVQICHSFIVEGRCYIITGSVVLPLESSKYAFVEYRTMSARGDWTDHQQIKITMSATD